MGMNSGFKTTDGLMRHLRKNGIAISGSAEKRQLINTGYYHGYKGYRFYNTASQRLPFQTYCEIYATIQYDSALKNLFYGKVMFIETAIKNIALERIMLNARSEKISDILDRVVSSYTNSPPTLDEKLKNKLQLNKLNLQKSIHSSLANAYYKRNPKIVHFYNNGYSEVPIWALFEILTMGDFGFLLSCLTYDVRDDISNALGIDTSCDTDRSLVFRYIYLLKDLRNAIAHNAVIFDTRFRAFDLPKGMRQFLKLKVRLPYVNFSTIGDYVILICFFLKQLGVSKTEIKAFIREFEKTTSDYKKSVNMCISDKVIHSDLSSRMNQLKNYI